MMNYWEIFLKTSVLENSLVTFKPFLTLLHSFISYFIPFALTQSGQNVYFQVGIEPYSVSKTTYTKDNTF